MSPAPTVDLIERLQAAAEIEPGRRQGRFRCLQALREGCGPWYLVLPEPRETVREAVSRRVREHEAFHGR